MRTPADGCFHSEGLAEECLTGERNVAEFEVERIQSFKVSSFKVSKLKTLSEFSRNLETLKP
jgi:hypothetical protein